MKLSLFISLFLLWAQVSVAQEDCSFFYKEDKVGILRKGNREVIPADYEQLIYKELLFSSVSGDSPVTIYNSLNKEHVNEATSHVKSLSLILAKRKGYWGMINWDNEVILPFQYDSLVEDSFQGVDGGVFKIYKEGYYGFCTAKGNVLIQPSINFHEHRPLIVWDEKNSAYIELWLFARNCQIRDLRISRDWQSSFLIDSNDPDLGSIDSSYHETKVVNLIEGGELNLFDIRGVRWFLPCWVTEVKYYKPTSLPAYYSYKDSLSLRYKCEDGMYNRNDTIKGALLLQLDSEWFFYSGRDTFIPYDSVEMILPDEFYRNPSESLQPIYKVYSRGHWGYNDHMGRLLLSADLISENAFHVYHQDGGLREVAVIQRAGTPIQLKTIARKAGTFYINEADTSIGTVDSIIEYPRTVRASPYVGVNILNCTTGKAISEQWFDELYLIVVESFWLNPDTVLLRLYKGNSLADLVSFYQNAMAQTFPFFLVKKEGKWGMISIDGKLVVPLVYDTLKPFYLARKRKIGRLVAHPLAYFIEDIYSSLAIKAYIREEEVVLDYKGLIIDQR